MYFCLYPVSLADRSAQVWALVRFFAFGARERSAAKMVNSRTGAGLYERRLEDEPRAYYLDIRSAREAANAQIPQAPHRRRGRIRADATSRICRQLIKRLN